jgi:hypothetical protein
MEDPDVDVRIILRWILKLDGRGGGGVDWIDVCKDRDKWWAVVKAIMNLWVP